MSDKFLKPPPLYLHLNMCFFFSPPTPHSLTLLHDVTFIVDVTVQIVAEDL